ncbi:MAG: hypothetical protein IPL59_15950 [Candidatus Competibacteraceae bacterium]|nr:hypothetical protein [Candidatus Competibacteraceae bacterium]
MLRRGRVIYQYPNQYIGIFNRNRIYPAAAALSNPIGSKLTLDQRNSPTVIQARSGIVTSGSSSVNTAR